MDYDTLTYGVFVGLSRKEEVLGEVRSCSRNFVLAPPCLLPAPVVAQAQLSQTTKGVTQVQVLRSVDI